MTTDNSRCPKGMDLLLPWYVKGTLSPGQMEEMRKHVRDCPFCCKELERIALEAGAVEDVERRVQVPWTFGELEEELGAEGWWSRLKGLVVSRPTPFLMGLAAQGVLCMVLLFFLLHGAAEKRYVTLSSSFNRRAQAVVVFDGRIKEAEMRRLLLEVGATIVGGPSPRGAYELAFPRVLSSLELERVLEKLKKEAGVRFVARYDKD